MSWRMRCGAYVAVRQVTSISYVHAARELRAPLSPLPQIERTLGTQSRVVVTPNGSFGFSKLGEQIEELVRNYNVN